VSVICIRPFPASIDFIFNKRGMLSPFKDIDDFDIAEHSPDAYGIHATPDTSKIDAAVEVFTELILKSENWWYDVKALSAVEKHPVIEKAKEVLAALRSAK